MKGEKAFTKVEELYEILKTKKKHKKAQKNKEGI
jgi:hypothetical protein